MPKRIPKPYLQHLKSSLDLATTYEAVRAGFVGAAIEPKMASEIWAMLEGGLLENAANLTDDDQIVSITRWLCNL